MNFFAKKGAQRLLTCLAILISSMLHFCAYPPIGAGALIWFAPIPLLLLCAAVPPRKAAWLSFISTALFWLSSLFWLTPVTYAGWVVIALYCALIQIPFFCWFSWITKRHDNLNAWWNLSVMLAAALVWGGLEHFRNIAFTGFPWNGLGIALYENIPVIQLARFGGVPLISALIVFFGTAVTLTVRRYIDLHGHHNGRWHPELMLAILLIALAHSSGIMMLRRPPQQTEKKLRIALLQPSIPQDQKWLMGNFTAEEYDDHRRFIYTRIQHLISAARASGPLDLMVLPETVVPDPIMQVTSAHQRITRFIQDGPPLLLGTLDCQWDENNAEVYYNSSMLLGPNGEKIAQYDKRHLVLFGEYIPDILSIFKSFSPVDGSLAAGHECGLLELSTNITAAPLICFEDDFPDMAREATQKGARLLITQTNDAWFDPFWGPEQHLAQGVFRSVENQIPTLRCANTGVTCLIGPSGKMIKRLDGNSNGLITPQFTCPDKSMPPTFYTRYGDLIPAIMLGAAISLLLFPIILRFRSPQTEDPDQESTHATAR